MTSVCSRVFIVWTSFGEWRRPFYLNPNLTPIVTCYFWTSFSFVLTNLNRPSKDSELSKRFIDHLWMTHGLRHRRCPFVKKKLRTNSNSFVNKQNSQIFWCVKNPVFFVRLHFIVTWPLEPLRSFSNVETVTDHRMGINLKIHGYRNSVSEEEHSIYVYLQIIVDTVDNVYIFVRRKTGCTNYYIF